MNDTVIMQQYNYDRKSMEPWLGLQVHIQTHLSLAPAFMVSTAQSLLSCELEIRQK